MGEKHRVRRPRSSLVSSLPLLASVLISGSACSRNDAEATARSSSPATSSAGEGSQAAAPHEAATLPPAAGRSADSPPASIPGALLPPLSDRLSRPAAPLVVAIGDLHGDLVAARRALRLAGAIDETDQWVGGSLVLVQTGDAIDRGDDDRALLDLLQRLRPQAQRAGGQLIAMSGNHELMNVGLNFGYVTRASMDAFASEGGRAAAFHPTGPYALMLADRPVVYQVGDTVFVHGGVLPKHVRYGLDRINDEVRAWMLGQRPNAPEIVEASDGLIWTRLYSLDTNEQSCALLGEALALLHAQRMVVGHTPQMAGITSACDGRVWRIDTGMSRYYGGPLEVLELRGDQVSARKEGPSRTN
jgi:hypothetical protein